MSLPYFPLYPTDFEADTSHLTLEEDGAFNRILRLMWMTPGCSLPDDDRWIMRRMRVDQATYDRVVTVIIDEFLVRKSGRIFSPRLAKEWQKTDLAHRKRVEAGKKGGLAKGLKTNKKTPSKAKAMPKQPEPEPYKKEDTNVSSQKKRGTRLSEDWCLPNDWGQWAVDEGWPEPVIRDQADRFRDYWISKPGREGVKLDWLATWRNWMRNSKAPKILNGGQHGNRTDTSERLQRTVAAAARGTSGQDWG